MNAQIAKSLGLTDTPLPSLAGPAQSKDLPSAEPTGDNEAHEVQDEDEDMGNEEFLFRLFSTAQPTQKVVLEDDVGPQGEGVFVAPRPLSHYTVTNLTGKQREEYDFAAVSGDELLQRSQTPFWGLELPWKVTRITVTRKARPGETSKEGKDVAKRTRPNKKQRIVLRKRVRLNEEKEKVVAQKLVEKEEQIKDKKKRLNRLKKLRRKAKSKEQKQAGNAGSGDESEGSS